MTLPFSRSWKATAAIAGGVIAAALVLFFAFPDSDAVANVEIINEGTAPDDAVFMPDTIIVSPGTTVIWTNIDASVHTVTSGMPGAQSDLFDSRVMGPGEEYSFRFADEGEFDYYCLIHPRMIGKIIVQLVFA